MVQRYPLTGKNNHMSYVCPILVCTCMYKKLMYFCLRHHLSIYTYTCRRIWRIHFTQLVLIIHNAHVENTCSFCFSDKDTSECRRWTLFFLTCISSASRFCWRRLSSEGGNFLCTDLFTLTALSKIKRINKWVRIFCNPPLNLEINVRSCVFL